MSCLKFFLHLEYTWRFESLNLLTFWLHLCFFQIHLRSAEKLKQLACSNGGVFIKVGQHIGALDYLLPPEYVTTMKVLHDQAPQSSLNEIKKVVEEDLSCKVSIDDSLTEMYTDLFGFDIPSF